LRIRQTKPVQQYRVNLLCPKEVLVSADVHDKSATESVEIPDTSAIVPE
jgi:hypothetical protein